MTAREHRALRYELDDPLAYKWTDAAYDMCIGEDPVLSAVVESSGGVTRVLISGACPRCWGDISGEETLTAAGESGVLGDAATGAPDPYTRVNVTCNCELTHGNRPTDVKTGCGITFALEVLRDDIT
ncbi:hypothetical protein OG741_29835 [Streptomyces sp. NBC_01410]|uniref:hypothetical protein n=1 Tax=Streptomyces sp. NBC_01410 TaxID=2903856 RepID=UPI003255A2AB